MSSSGSELKRADRRFLTKAAEGGMKEVALSELAQERAANPQVKSFAQQMVTDHTQMNNDLMQLAQRKGVSLEEGSRFGWLSGHGSRTNGASDTSGSAMTGTTATDTSKTGVASTTGTPAGTAMNSGTDSDITNDRHYRNLAKKSGADFDKEYVDMMVDDHESDVKLFEKAAKDAKDPEVRSFASAHLPTIQAHLQHIQTLNKSVAE